MLEARTSSGSIRARRREWVCGSERKVRAMLATTLSAGMPNACRVVTMRLTMMLKCSARSSCASSSSRTP